MGARTCSQMMSMLPGFNSDLLPKGNDKAQQVSQWVPLSNPRCHGVPDCTHHSNAHVTEQVDPVPGAGGVLIMTLGPCINNRPVRGVGQGRADCNTTIVPLLCSTVPSVVSSIFTSLAVIWPSPP
jgi:hypothetical protein